MWCQTHIGNIETKFFICMHNLWWIPFQIVTPFLKCKSLTCTPAFIVNFFIHLFDIHFMKHSHYLVL
ncbi:hypothetical protein HMPREF1146_2006 [Prevotella sp. MSX73]|nr:hypothetical protein HMPREF1146_2006 [Prevotella sp. MSX73]